MTTPTPPPAGSGAFDPQPCAADSGASSTPRHDVESSLLCDFDANGDVVGSALAVFDYDDTTGAPIGAPTFVHPTTGAAYVPVGTLRPCLTPPCGDTEVLQLCDTLADGSQVSFLRHLTFDCEGVSGAPTDTTLDGVTPYTATAAGLCSPPIFAGFVCDISGDQPAVPPVPPSCPGAAVGPALAVAGAGMTQGPAGTFTPTGTVDPTVTIVPSAQDAQHGLCSVSGQFSAGSGNDPFWQVVVQFFDVNGNLTDLTGSEIAALQASMGVGDLSDIPPGTTGSVVVNGTTVTVTVDGPSPHLQTFAGNGALFVRQTDGDGLAAGFTLAFDPPARSVRMFTNVGTPSPGAITALTSSEATPGAVAIPAMAAGRVQVKQFRDPDGAAFYENLDGTAHPVVGVIGDCGNTFSEVLCDAGNANKAFVRVYDLVNGNVVDFTDYDLDGAGYFVIGPPVVCDYSRDYRHTPTEVLCWTNTATQVSTPFLRRYLVAQDGVQVVAVIDTLLDGFTAFNASNLGTVGVCFPAAATAAADSDFEDDLVCAGGVGYVRRTTITGGVPAVTYLDGAGSPVPTPAGPITNGACPGAASASIDDEYVLLCDGGTSPPTPFLRRERESAGVVTTSDLTLAGAAYAVVGAVGVCGQQDQAVSTFLRNITGVAPLNPVALRPGLQSATLVVVTGSVQVTTTDGVAAVPAGVSLTWAVSDDDDSALQALSFAGATATANYLVACTYKGSSAG